MAIRYVNLGLASNGTGAANDPYNTLSISFSAGDEVRVAKSAPPTLVGNATWTSLGTPHVSLASSVVYNINNCDNTTNWSVANATLSTSTTNRKEGTAAITITNTSGTTNVLIATYTLPAAVDLSAYQQISFWHRTNVTNQEYYIKLYNDADALVYDGSASGRYRVYGTSTFNPIVINTGAALSTTFKKMEIWRGDSVGSANVSTIDNILACKAPSAADSLTLQSLISKNVGSREDKMWYPIKSIVGTTIMLDQNPGAVITSMRGYYGTTETVATYKREATSPGIGLPIVAATVLYTIQTSGSADNYIDIQGGWDLSDTQNPVQNGETFIQGRHGMGYAINMNNKSYIKFSKFGFSAVDTAFRGQADNWIITDIWCTGCTNYALQGVTQWHSMRIERILVCNNMDNALQLVNCDRSYIKDIIANNQTATNGAIYFNSAACGNIIENIEANNNSVSGLALGLAYNNRFIGTNTFKYNGTSGVRFVSGACGNHFYNVRTEGNNNAGVDVAVAEGIINYFYDYSYTEGTPVNFLASSLTDYCHPIIFSNRDTNANNTHVYYTKVGRADYDTLTVVGNSQAKWKISTSSVNCIATNPIAVPIGQYYVVSGLPITVTANILRVSGAAISAGLRLTAQQLPGLNAEVTSLGSAANNTWGLVTLNAGTPTRSGVIELFFIGYGSSSSAYIDISSINVSQ